MSFKISVIIPIGGNDTLRERNFEHCIRSIKEQKFEDYEVIIVEQSSDPVFYKQKYEGGRIKWIGIKDPLNRGFNLSWCRNVGARIATGEKIILMDGDMSFQDGYFEEVSKIDSVFAGGAYKYHWIREEHVTKEFEKERDFSFVYNFRGGSPTDPVFRFETFTKGCGYGAVLVFDRVWYLECFGGYPEDFFKYGWEDKAGIEIIKSLLELNNDFEMKKVNYEIVHLSHYSKDMRNMGINERIYNRIRNSDKKELAKKAVSLKLGDPKEPKMIL